MEKGDKEMKILGAIVILVVMRASLTKRGGDA